MRASAVVVACLLGAWCARASADAIDTNVRDLSPAARTGYKVRLAAALALSKSKDGRAVIAVSDALEHDDDATIRRVAALALIKMIDENTDADAMDLALAALNSAAATDPDAKVRDAAARTGKTVAGYHVQKKQPAAAAARPSGSGGGGGNRPSVFVNVDAVTDQSKKLSAASAQRLQTIVQKDVAATGYSTSWPGGLPTQAQLGNARAYIVASTVKTVDIARSGSQSQIGCTVAIRVAPWSGKDGGERWEANKAASASGSAKVTTGTGAKDIEGGVHDCIEAVGEDITNRQVVPFLKKLATMP
jgi:hypothetical protein